MAILVPGIAQADFGVSTFSATTTQPGGALDTRAGGHPFLGTTAFILNSNTVGGTPSGGVLKNIHVDVPPGVTPNPESTPKCAATVPAPGLCSPASQIGEADVYAGSVLLPPITVPVYNMEPAPGVLSDFAFSLGAPAPRTDIIGSVRDTSDYGVSFDIRNLSGSPAVVGSTLRFFGVPSEHVAGGSPLPFLTNPTFCGPPYTTVITVESQTGQIATKSDTTPTGATGCDQVPFNPTISVTPGTTKRDSPTGGSVGIHVPYLLEPDGIESSHVKDTSITLPEGVSINPSAANGLEACTDAQLAKGTHDPVGCPAASKIGTVEIVSGALAAPLTGSVWVGQPQGDDHLYRIFLQATGPMGLDVRLKGDIAANPATGRLTATFADTPQVPFKDFTLTLDGGPRAVLATPLACGDASTSSSIVPYRGGAPATPTASFTVDGDGAGGGPCGSLFAPAFSASTSSTQAAGDTALSIGVARQDGQQNLSKLQISTPPGFTGRVPAVPRCADAAASAGTCGEASRIGTATVAAGAGSDPFKISGPVYFTGPYKGSPYGLSVVIRAIAGPYDLGTVVVRAGISVNRIDGHLTVDSDALPTILKGVPLRLRTVDVKIDRAGFLLNGTACGTQSVGSRIDSLQGTTVTPSGAIGVTGCDKLAFTPTITAVASGRPTRARGGSLFVTLNQPAGQMNMSRVSVQLPKPFSAQGKTTSKACLEPVFLADPDKCAAVSRVGTAEAVSPVLPTSLSGNVWLVGHNARLPTLEVRLNGSGVEIGLTGLIKYGTGYASTFSNLPDVPVKSFTIKIPQSKTPLLGIAGTICAKPLSVPVNYTGQDGRKRQQIARLQVLDCPVTVKSARTLRGGRTLLTIKVPTAGKLAVTGSGLRGVKRTLKRAAGAAHVTVSLSKRGQQRLADARAKKRPLKLTATVRLVPKKASATATVKNTVSSVRRVLVLR